VDGSLACGWRSLSGRCVWSGGETEGEERICPAPPPGWFVGCACQELNEDGRAGPGPQDSERRPFLVICWIGLIKGGLIVDAEESRQHLSCSGAPASASASAGEMLVDG